MIEAAPEPQSRRFSLPHLLLIVPWVALVIDAWSPLRDNSFLWHIRAGSMQLANGTVLTEDPFSFTMLGTPWLTQGWLAELLYGWSESQFDLDFVPMMILGAGFVAFAAIGLISFRSSQSTAVTAILMLLSTVLFLGFLVPRPVIFSFGLFGLVVLAWESPRLRWTLPFLFWIWASTHGSFVLGLAFVGLSIIMRREWRWLPAALAAGLTTLITAHGVGVVRMLADFAAARETLDLLVEWRKPELANAVFLPFVAGILLILVGAGRRLISPRHLWLIIPFLALGLNATRAVPTAWVGLLPLVSRSGRGWFSNAQRRFSMGAAAVFCVVVAGFPFLITGDGSLDPERFPIEASRSLVDVPTFHDDVAGGYLIWAEGPDRLVFLDDRAELYGDRIAEFVAVRDGRLAWMPVFQRDGIEQVMLKSEEELIGELREAGWQEVFAGGIFVVMRDPQ